MQLVADNRSAKCAGNYRVAGSSPALPVRRQVTQPGRVCIYFLHHCWCDAPLVGKCRRNYSLLSSWSRVRVPPLPLQWQGSSAVEHENVSPTLVVRSRQMPKELQLPGPVQCRFESCPCCDGRVAQSGRGAVKDFFNTRCRAFEFLVRWFYRRTATVYE